ncbi:SixA phosphatase family protein [Massilia jejuensis]|uniref:SixA phosphatase family protein n=1 Tax=Massilia jejuensis TaxID=648894 RepID=A0ABW0PHT7_9BURK
MDLILWRHAEAEDGERDAKRALTSKGRRQAARVGAWLDHQLPEHCRVLVSPAVRCLQTADALRRHYTIHEALNTDSTAERMLEVCGWPGNRFPALLIGHQPLLGELASLIVTGAPQPWKIRKASVFWIKGSDAEDSTPFIRLAVGPELIGKMR